MEKPGTTGLLMCCDLKHLANEIKPEFDQASTSNYKCTEKTDFGGNALNDTPEMKKINQITACRKISRSKALIFPPQTNGKNVNPKEGNL